MLVDFLYDRSTLVPVRSWSASQQTITWTGVEPVAWRNMASLPVYIYVCVIDRMHCSHLLLVKIKDSWLLTACTHVVLRQNQYRPSFSTLSYWHSDPQAMKTTQLSNAVLVEGIQAFVRRLCHYGDVTRAQCRFKSPAIRMFVQRLAQADNINELLWGSTSVDSNRLHSDCGHEANIKGPPTINPPPPPPTTTTTTTTTHTLAQGASGA